MFNNNCGSCSGGCCSNHPHHNIPERPNYGVQEYPGGMFDLSNHWKWNLDFIKKLDPIPNLIGLDGSQLMLVSVDGEIYKVTLNQLKDILGNLT